MPDRVAAGDAGVAGWISAELQQNVIEPIADFQNPDQEWRRLLSEFLGTGSISPGRSWVARSRWRSCSVVRAVACPAGRRRRASFYTEAEKRREDGPTEPPMSVRSGKGDG